MRLFGRDRDGLFPGRWGETSGRGALRGDKVVVGRLLSLSCFHAGHASFAGGGGCEHRIPRLNTSVFLLFFSLFFHTKTIFFETTIYIKQASLLIKDLPIPLDTLIRKKMCLKLAASSLSNSYIPTRLFKIKLRGLSTQLQERLFKKTELS
jgi:hypothetical protein